MTPSYVSVHTIIAKVFSDLDLQETSHRLIDLINWAGEAVEKIGAVRQLHFKKTGEDGLDNIKVKDYHAKLPRDLFKLATVTYSPQKEEPDSNTRWFPMRTTTNTFKSGPSDNLTSDYTYFLKPGWININRRDGWLKLAYYVFPTDNDGYPLIPDTATYQEAVYWYIVMKLLYPKWLSGQVRDGQYIDAQDNWAIYKQKAYAEAIMPSTPSEWEAILHEYTRLVPDLNSADTQQGLLGDQELIHNQNRHFYLNNQNRFSIEF